MVRPRHSVAFVGFIALVILTIFLILTKEKIPSEVFCQTDSDCVPAECCHPVTTVNKNFAPKCEGVFCTAVCAPNTLDCNQGKIKCVNNKCVAVMESSK